MLLINAQRQNSHLQPHRALDGTLSGRQTILLILCQNGPQLVLIADIASENVHLAPFCFECIPHGRTRWSDSTAARQEYGIPTTSSCHPRCSASPGASNPTTVEVRPQIDFAVHHCVLLADLNKSSEGSD